MLISGPTVALEDAMHLIALVDERADLAHLQIKKYRNFLTIFSFEGRRLRRHARLALRCDRTWQVHLPAASDEWRATRLTGSFNDLTRILFDTYGVELGRGPDALKAILSRDRYVGLAS